MEKQNSNDTKPYPVAVLCSDIHLTSRTPVARSEKDWFEVQAHYLAQLRLIQINATKEYDQAVSSRTESVLLPVLIAGDIFDRWNPSPELINFALEHLPDRIIAVPGQHDLPNHRIEDMNRSGYGVLVKAGKITCASTVRRREKSARFVSRLGFRIYGFGWGEEIEHNPTDDGFLQVALIHKFVWTPDTGYYNAPDSSRLRKFKDQLRSYDVAVFGDNHKGFLAEMPGTRTVVFNCGGFIRRRSDEVGYSPRVGILYSNGNVVPESFDTRKDQWHHDAQEREKRTEDALVDIQEFMSRLKDIGEHGLDFVSTVRRSVQNGSATPPHVRDLVLKFLEDEGR
jgi:hypothetical protein